MGSQVPPSQQQSDFQRFNELAGKAMSWARTSQAIIQNPGHNPTGAEEIEVWLDNVQRELAALHAEMVRHTNKVAARLREGDYDKSPLGYYRDGTPIYELSAGMIATACILSCSNCQKVIRGMGGPSTGALCPGCYKES